MLSRSALNALLERMEAGLVETRRTLFAVEHKLENRAEVECISRRPKARHYRRLLDEMLVVTRPKIDRLRGRAERQLAAIEALRRKYGVNAERPYPASGGFAS